ncbi:MAG: hypothetical protein ACLFWL_17990 [Candidatus Brocadiia bacterium]
MTTEAPAEVQTDQTEQEDAHVIEDIPGGVLKALHAHTAPEKGRYSLNCIHVEGREIVAADGAVLARVTLPEDLGPEGLYELPKPHLKKRKPARLIRRNGELRAEQSDGSSARVEIFQSPGEDGRWPEHYVEVIPPESQGTQVISKLEYLQQALDLLDCAGYETARITFTGDPGSPFRIDGLKTDERGQEIEGEIGATVVISPVVLADGQ